MKDSNIIQSIRELVKAKKSQGIIPTKLALTLINEDELADLSSLELGELQSDFASIGPRLALAKRDNKFMNLTVTWDASELSVD